MNTGKTIAELRTAANMSQQALADALFVSRDLVSKWENGTRRPDSRMIESLAALFGVSPELLADRNSIISKELSECFPSGAVLSEAELTERLNAFLRGLSAKNADVFVKRYYFQERIADISAAYGIGENHLRSMLSKLRKRLKKFIAEGKSWTN